MPNLNLGNAYELTSENINKLVEQKTGNYALGNFRKSSSSLVKKFFPHYVGSSFTDLRAEIIQQGISLKINQKGTPKYTHFKFSHDANTAIKAFKKECQNYHDFKSILENERHPKRPEGKTPQNLKCPVKNCNL